MFISFILLPSLPHQPVIFSQQAILGIMELKERMVHFLQQASERLRLSYQPTLQAIQVLNVLDHPRSAPTINRHIRTLPRAHCFAAGLLALTSKLYDAKPIHMRDLIRILDPRYKEMGIEQLERTGSEDKHEDITMSAHQMGELVRESEAVVMVQLRWKLAMPLLYDQTIAVAYAWDGYAATLTEFPLRFQCARGREESSCSGNHNYLVRNIRVCLYNFNHLIRQTLIQALSLKIRRLSLALFLTSIKQLLKDQTQSYILSPKLSIAYLLSDFFKKCYGVQLEEVAGQVALVAEVLASYRQFREKSKQKMGKKGTHKTNKHSEDKENVAYYVNRQKIRSKSKQPNKENDQRSEKYKSRSRSKLEKEKSKDKVKLTSSKLDRQKSRDGPHLKSKESIVLKVKHKKSSSTKSIFPQREDLPTQFQQQVQKKTVKFSKSRTSKRSQKSQLNSKLIPSCTLQGDFCSKSTYWLKANPNPLVKTDKKSNNSSIRMKLR